MLQNSCRDQRGEEDRAKSSRNQVTWDRYCSQEQQVMLVLGDVDGYLHIPQKGGQPRVPSGGSLMFFVAYCQSKTKLNSAIELVTAQSSGKCVRKQFLSHDRGQDSEFSMTYKCVHDFYVLPWEWGMFAFAGGQVSQTGEASRNSFLNSGFQPLLLWEEVPASLPREVECSQHPKTHQGTIWNSRSQILTLVLMCLP